MYDDDEGGEYEYVETPEDHGEDPKEAYVKRMIKESKDQDGQFKRPDYKPSSVSKEIDENEYEPGPAQKEPEEEPPKKEEKAKEEYDL